MESVMKMKGRERKDNGEREREEHPDLVPIKAHHKQLPI